MTDQQDHMDQRLRDYGARWRNDLPGADQVDVDLLTTGPAPKPNWWLIPAAAAAVVAVIVGAQLTGSERQTPAQPRETVRPGGVVPWAPLSATHPQIPKVVIPPVPDPAAAADASPCHASDLRVGRPDFEGAAGTILLGVRVTLIGQRPCRVEGFPNVETLDNGRPIDIPIEQSADDSTYLGPMLIAKGQPVLISLWWPNNWCATAVHNDTIAVRLPHGGGQLSFAGFGSSPPCNSGPASGPTPIMVRPFQPKEFRPERVRSAYGPIDVSGDLDLTATPHQQVPFKVTLTAPADIVLNPCPDYIIDQYGTETSQVERFALNCADIPYKDATGSPYLPANTPVRFAMQTTAGASSATKLLWQLVAPGNTKALGGRLTVQ